MSKRFSLVIGLSAFLVSHGVLANEPVTAEKVLQSILTNHPKLLELEAKNGQRLQDMA